MTDNIDIEDNYYKILQINRNATSYEIKTAYKKLSILYHPDKSTGDEVLYKKIVKAYNILSNENQRLLYDSTFFSNKEDNNNANHFDYANYFEQFTKSFVIEKTDETIFDKYKIHDNKIDAATFNNLFENLKNVREVDDIETEPVNYFNNQKFDHSVFQHIVVNQVNNNSTVFDKYCKFEHDEKYVTYDKYWEDSDDEDKDENKKIIHEPNVVYGKALYDFNDKDDNYDGIDNQFIKLHNIKNIDYENIPVIEEDKQIDLLAEYNKLKTERNAFDDEFKNYFEKNYTQICNDNNNNQI